MSSTVKSVMMYPIVLCGILSLVVGALIFFVLPQFSKVFTGMGKTPPLQTRILIEVSSYLRSHVVVIAGAAAVFGMGIWRFTRTEIAARYWDNFLITSRLVRKPVRALMTGRSFRLLGTMLQSGIPLLEGIRLCRASVRNRVFRQLFDSMDHSVVGGGSIGVVLK